MDDETTLFLRRQRTPKAQPPRRKPTIDQAVQGKIGEQLRAMYDGLKAEPIPDHLLAILKQLEALPSEQNS